MDMKERKGTSGKKPIATVDWDRVHHRIENARLALKREGVLPLEEMRKILKTRAKALGHESRGREEPEEYIEVVEFLLANEKYGIQSNYVRETYPLKELTPLPCTPPFVLGIISVRGQILSVIDIKKFFDLPEKGLGDLNKVIIIHNGKMEFGILADVILGTRLIPVNEIQPSLPTLTGIRAEYLKGVAKDRLVILDGEKLLADKKLIVHQEVT
jgi:purine-binding chemotaxis protein CheW